MPSWRCVCIAELWKFEMGKSSSKPEKNLGMALLRMIWTVYKFRTHLDLPVGNSTWLFGDSTNLATQLGSSKFGLQTT